MGKKVEIKTNVRGADKVADALLRGLNDGLEDTGNTLLRKGEEFAKDEVVGARRVWTEEVKRGFDSKEEDSIAMGRNYAWRGSIFNPVKHADVVDRGLAPAGEIEGSDPSVQDIMPWVVDNLSPADYDGGGGDPGFTPGSPYDGGSGGITDPDASVSNYREVSEKGIQEYAMESENPRIAELENGREVIFKSRDGPNSGAVRNEVVWSRSQEIAPFDNVGPRSRSDKTIIEGEEVTGTIQEWVPDSDEFVEAVDIGKDADLSGDAVSRVEFMRENTEWLASTRALDYIHGNQDRHRGNIRFKNGEPKAIDNGGARYDDGLRAAMLKIPGELSDYRKSDNEEELLQENLNSLDDLEEVFGDLENNLQYRKQIIEASEEVHGTDSKYHQRLVDVIGEDVGEDHFLSENEDGVPLYQQHINERRDILQQKYDTRDQTLGEKLKEDEEDINDAIDDVLGDI